MWTFDKVKKAFSGRLVGKKQMISIVCKALLFLPDANIDYVCNNVWFISSPEDAWAFTFRGSDVKNQSLIFISDDLLKQKKSLVIYTILHEIGHVILKHRNSMGYMQSNIEVRKQEKEADAFVRKYFK